MDIKTRDYVAAAKYNNDLSISYCLQRLQGSTP